MHSAALLNLSASFLSTSASVPIFSPCFCHLLHRFHFGTCFPWFSTLPTSLLSLDFLPFIHPYICLYISPASMYVFLSLNINYRPPLLCLSASANFLPLPTSEIRAQRQGGLKKINKDMGSNLFLRAPTKGLTNRGWEQSSK